MTFHAPFALVHDGNVAPSICLEVFLQIFMNQSTEVGLLRR